jgi:NAD(P)-dependent dehydrogenase (short-subunit alcohol dehydrogenase family)
MTEPPVALVTGCSSGIGAATARNLVKAGYRVYATARDVESLRGLEGVVPLALDVTDEDSMKQAVARITSENGRLDLLVNNAGYGLAGAAEETSIDQVRDQFEVNFFGLVRLTQLVLPGMREHGAGTIVNLSSIFGRLAVPGGAFYMASKYALEAYSEALRLEVASFGVHVVLVEPGPVKTGFGHAAVTSLGESGGGLVYKRFRADLTAWYKAVYEGPKKNIAGVFAVSPEAVARTVTRAAKARHPHARYPVGFLSRMLIALRRFSPQFVYDAFVKFQFPVPKG